METQHGKF
jgi:protein phosphatase 1G